MQGPIMKPSPLGHAISLSLALMIGAAGIASVALAGQAPGPLNAPDVPISHRDRVYAAEQFSNTVSVTDPTTTGCSVLSGWATPRPAI